MHFYVITLWKKLSIVNKPKSNQIFAGFHIFGTDCRVQKLFSMLKRIPKLW